MAINRYTDEEIEKLVPDIAPELEAWVATLIARADSGDDGAVEKLMRAIEAYAEHPDLVVRYLARRVLALENARLQ